MKRSILFILMLVLTVTVFVGCRSKNEPSTTVAPTTAATMPQTMPSTEATVPETTLAPTQPSGEHPSEGTTNTIPYETDTGIIGERSVPGMRSIR